MNRLIVVLIVVSCAVASPTPKIAESSKSSAWENFLKVGEDIQVKENTASPSGRSFSENSIEDHVEQYIKGHEFTFDLPIAGSSITVDARNLDTEEVDVKLKFSSGSEVQARKKSKIKKIFIPILVFIMIKAITLIPLALGILGIKTWNAIQLSFISFVTTLAMAVWKICSKVNGDHPHPQIIHHDAYDHHHAAARADDLQMAYGGYSNVNNNQ